MRCKTQHEYQGETVRSCIIRCIDEQVFGRRFGGRGYLYLSPAFFCWLILFGIISCTAHRPYAPRLIDFSQFQDQPLTDEVSEWLKPGKQSAVTPAIADAVAGISGLNRRERLYKALDYFENNFKYDNWYNDKAFTRTADLLFRERLLGGCSDYALVKVTLFRALGIPAKLVLTANVDWMLAYQKNELLISTGHVFIEVFLEDRWFLVDSVYRLIFTDYDPRISCYPRREYFCARGRDYWEIDITDIAKIDNILRQKALSFNEALYTDPQYPSVISMGLQF